MRADLYVWSSFPDYFDGSHIILDEGWDDNSRLNRYTDTAVRTGFGIFYQGHWSYGMWTRGWRRGTPDVPFKELFPIVLAVHL